MAMADLQKGLELLALGVGSRSTHSFVLCPMAELR